MQHTLVIIALVVAVIAGLAAAAGATFGRLSMLGVAVCAIAVALLIPAIQ